MISVVKGATRRRSGGKGNVIYVARPAALGNPFVLERGAGDGERESVIRKYETWLRAKIHDRSPIIMTALQLILAVEATHGEVRLACWCAPRPCHADIIKKLLEGEEREIVRTYEVDPD